MEPSKSKWKLLRRRQVLMPTWRGWLVLLAGFIGLAIVAILKIHPFLAVNAPLSGGSMVVEGWASDYALQRAVAEFHGNHYDKMYVTGGPIEAGAPLSEYKTYAQRGGAVLSKLGMSTNELQVVPAPWVRQDRTYTAALSLANWLRTDGVGLAKVHLITEDTHARRSRLLYQKALGKGVKVGVTAIPPGDYNPSRWWHSSVGVRSVIGETLAYGYARFFFWP
ncbi:MAG TPA: ElyC/SanA/YdcF family protein [Candidatus Acidoferrum sp.]|jgi:hypothetical protein|nr:ElyC/SanA/YdcF family protein [Candidatus Acidoferrum sp.]